MRVWLEVQRTTGIDRRDVKALPDNEYLGRASGACPQCGAEPFHLEARAPRIMDDDRTLRANGWSVCCGDAVGYVYAQPETIFGLREDAAVLQGRARVYGAR